MNQCLKRLPDVQWLLFHFIQPRKKLEVNANTVCIYHNGAEGMAQWYAKPKAKAFRGFNWSDQFTQPANPVQQAYSEQSG